MNIVKRACTETGIFLKFFSLTTKNTPSLYHITNHFGPTYFTICGTFRELLESRKVVFEICVNVKISYGDVY